MRDLLVFDIMITYTMTSCFYAFNVCLAFIREIKLANCQLKMKIIVRNCMFSWRNYGNEGTLRFAMLLERILCLSVSLLELVEYLEE